MNKMTSPNNKIISEDPIEHHKKMKNMLMKKEEQMHFSYGLEATLTDDERKAGEKIIKLRNKLSDPSC